MEAQRRLQVSAPEIEALSAQLAALRADVEAGSPQARARREDRELADRRQRYAAVTSIQHWLDLQFRERAGFLRSAKFERLCEMIRIGSTADRDRLLAELPVTTRAAIAIALAPAPQIMRVSSPKLSVRVHSVGIDAEQAAYCEAAGLEVVEDHRGYRLDGFTLDKAHRAATEIDAEAWAARLELDEALRTAITTGLVVAERLSDEAARASRLRAYNDAWASIEDAHVLGGPGRVAFDPPPLPTIPPAPSVGEP